MITGSSAVEDANAETTPPTGNGVAGLIFFVVAELDWRAIALLAGGSIVGGYIGSRIGNRLPAPALRAGIVVAGVVAAVAMLS